VQFAELFAVSATGTRSASATACASPTSRQQFTQGNVDFTDGSLDMAISGEGFFILSDGGARCIRAPAPSASIRNGYVVNSEQPAPAGVRRIRRADSTPAPSRTCVWSRARVRRRRPERGGGAEPAGRTPPRRGRDLRSADPDSYTTTHLEHRSTTRSARAHGTRSTSKTATANTWTQRLYVDGAAGRHAADARLLNTGALQTPAGGQIVPSRRTRRPLARRR
jgi:flagellar hook protein FlgE